MEGRIQINVRTDLDLQMRFEKKCADMKRSKHAVVKELIEAFAEGRLKIAPTDTQKEVYQQ